MKHNELSAVIIDTAIRVHRKLGPGLLESVYREIMHYELQKQGLTTEKEKPISVRWEGVDIDIGFRADLVVAEKVIVELKSLEKVAPVHKKQLLTYLRVTNLRLGLLINFGEVLLKDGITRIVNNLEEE